MHRRARCLRPCLSSCLLQVITLEGWVEIMYYVMDAHSFYNFIYFILLIIVSIRASVGPWTTAPDLGGEGEEGRAGPREPAGLEEPGKTEGSQRSGRPISKEGMF